VLYTAKRLAHIVYVGILSRKVRTLLELEVELQSTMSDGVGE